MQTHSNGAAALDFACGDGTFAFTTAEAGANAIGIDMSETSIHNAQREAARGGLNATFQAMDCESMSFPNWTFDLISVCGVLHHMDLDRAFSELARVLRMDGSVVCAEPLAHNPVFQAYPLLRTEYEAEHILRRRDLFAATNYFNHVELRFFNLFDLVAVPFRNARIFNQLLSALERIDTVLLEATPLRWWAWQVLFLLSEPKKLQSFATPK